MAENGKGNGVATPRTNGRAGYEGNTSMYVYGLPAHTWGDDVEQTIATSVQNQVRQLKAAPGTR